MNGEKEIPIEDYSRYEKVFRTTEIDIVSPEENPDWSLNEPKGKLETAIRRAGEESLEENNGIIYTTLSGGIDSTLCLCFLRKIFGPETEIVTFTLGGSEAHPDIQNARLVSEKYKTRHYELIPTPEEIHEGLEEFRKEKPDEDLKEAVERGDFDVYLLLKKISESKPNTLIMLSGIDEQLGGYWEHRRNSSPTKRKEVFRELWRKFRDEQLKPTVESSRRFDITVLFPYLDEELVEFVSKIPVKDRTSKEVSKIPLRQIAGELGVPQEVIERTKRGASGMTDIEELRELIQP